jgi:iron complex outermembrane receptor protein
MARGNSTLQVETNTGFEVGYRGDLSDRFYISVDAYFNSLGNFVTDLLPGVNPAFKFWTSPTAVPAAFRGALEGAVRSALLANPASRTAGLGLTRQEDGNTAIVLSYSNAGSATQWGTDIGAGFHFTDELTGSASFSWFDYSVNTDELASGDKLLANTPEFRYTGALNYTGRSGLDLGASFRASTGFPWSAGVFSGWIEPGFTLDATAGYRLSNNLRVFLTGNNILNEQWFSVYGGSVNGRRVMAGRRRCSGRQSSVVSARRPRFGPFCLPLSTLDSRLTTIFRC